MAYAPLTPEFWRSSPYQDTLSNMVGCFSKSSC